MKEKVGRTGGAMHGLESSVKGFGCSHLSRRRKPSRCDGMEGLDQTGILERSLVSWWKMQERNGKWIVEARWSLP